MCDKAGGKRQSSIKEQVGSAKVSMKRRKRSLIKKNRTGNEPIATTKKKNTQNQSKKLYTTTTLSFRSNAYRHW